MRAVNVGGWKPTARAGPRLGIAGGVILSLLLAGCAGSPGSGVDGGHSPPPCPSGQPIVVAAENFWGSIAAQVAGERACVRSVIVNPDTDPHAYEAKPSDARLFASARYVIVNGAGYDPWALKLLAASPAPDRKVLNVAELIGKRAGDNPHLWYSPDYVLRFVDRIGADLATVDPQSTAYFDQRRAEYRTTGLENYLATVSTIKEKYRGTPVGATESIFVYMAEALGLNLLSPLDYMKAISEGTDPSAASKAAIEQQVSSRSIKVLVFNSQNTTREVTGLVNRARANRIPVAEVTETLTPAGSTFQDWQARQLKGILAALGG